jgi:hypothetical protein
MGRCVLEAGKYGTYRYLHEDTFMFFTNKAAKLHKCTHEDPSDSYCSIIRLLYNPLASSCTPLSKNSFINKQINHYLYLCALLSHVCIKWSSEMQQDVIQWRPLVIMANNVINRLLLSKSVVPKHSI